MKHYKQLALEQRYQIYAFRKGGMSLTKIAQEIGCDKSSISREIKRNKGSRGYRPKQAERKANWRKKNSHKAVKLNTFVKQRISELIQKDWSPEQISGYLTKHENIRISHETIYRYVLEDKNSGGALYLHLRCRKKKYKKRYGSNDGRGHIPNRKSIEIRPEIVDKKARIGDWEADTMIGKNHKGALVTIVERVTKFTLIAQVDNKSAENVTNAIIRLLQPFASLVHTITVDNGKEFAFHEKVSKSLNTEVFFAHPYSSWERGLNENTNGLIRQYIPKKSVINSAVKNLLESVMTKLNFRPRKSLNFDFPQDLFYTALKLSGVALVS